MAAPDFVPIVANRRSRSYESAPWRDLVWIADRPSDIDGRQPEGEMLGNPGPDLGYALKLARRFEGTMALAPHESEADAIAGATAVAMKRASAFGRGPVIFDLQVGLAIWGLLDASADPELVALRTEMFEEAHHPHHYVKLRAIADATSIAVLRRPHGEIIADAVANWRRCITL